jgi:hypothetical protein
MIPSVFSGFYWVFASQMMFAASYWLSQREGAKSPFLDHSELSMLNREKR